MARRSKTLIEVFAAEAKPKTSRASKAKRRQIIEKLDRLMAEAVADPLFRGCVSIEVPVKSGEIGTWKASRVEFAPEMDNDK